VVERGPMRGARVAIVLEQVVFAAPPRPQRRVVR